jgi:hypothetical protein
VTPLAGYITRKVVAAVRRLCHARNLRGCAERHVIMPPGVSGY